MNWSSKKPDSVGYWWYRTSAQGPEVHMVYGSFRDPSRLFLAYGCDVENDVPIEDAPDGEYAGPIPEPEEAVATAQNNAMPKLPKWEDVYKACFSKLPNGDLGAHALRVQAGLQAYEFIVRQLSA